ncbi:hypothetical protein BT63DRAFT_419268 [Microthyrium microscopicum]|uniref:Uncharacterized protein n=1 Tax=Microthyrium microscopicum TaxID=703497 RepID=A0A6A6TT18_9PEZI|nr:hypothetical protein BT63DRAFT_419268 [Microthyrium microscopicum]
MSSSSLSPLQAGERRKNRAAYYAGQTSLGKMYGFKVIQEDYPPGNIQVTEIHSRHDPLYRVTIAGADLGLQLLEDSAGHHHLKKTLKVCLKASKREKSVDDEAAESLMAAFFARMRASFPVVILADTGLLTSGSYNRRPTWKKEWIKSREGWDAKWAGVIVVNRQLVATLAALARENATGSNFQMTRFWYVGVVRLAIAFATQLVEMFMCYVLQDNSYLPWPSPVPENERFGALDEQASSKVVGNTVSYYGLHWTRQMLKGDPCYAAFQLPAEFSSLEQFNTGFATMATPDPMLPSTTLYSQVHLDSIENTAQNRINTPFLAAIGRTMFYDAILNSVPFKDQLPPDAEVRSIWEWSRRGLPATEMAPPELLGDRSVTDEEMERYKACPGFNEQVPRPLEPAFVIC